MFKAADMSIWKGRTDDDGGDRSLRWHQCVTAIGEASGESGTALLGICCDEGVRRNMGRTGAAGGPDAIRPYLSNLPFLLDRPLYDAGNLYCEEGQLELLQEEHAELVRKLLNQNHFPLVLGGGHEIAFGNFSGFSRHLRDHGPVGPTGIINFDAHFDLRRAGRPNSGTPFLQAADLCRENNYPFKYFCLGISRTSNSRTLFDRAEDLSVDYLLDEELYPWKMAEAEQKLASFVRECRQIYLSIDLDVLPAATAPGVSAPAARGVPLEILEHLLNFVTSEAGSKIKISDIAEHNPDFDIDGRTARTAAALCHLLVAKNGGSHE